MRASYETFDLKIAARLGNRRGPEMAYSEYRDSKGLKYSCEKHFTPVGANGLILTRVPYGFEDE